jgi:anti-sigma B factor antagonist
LAETIQKQAANVHLISLGGHVRMGEIVDKLRQDIDLHLNAGNVRIVVNMANVKSLDSSGIGVLVRSLSLAKQKGGDLKLSHVPAGAAQTLQVTGIWRLFDVFNTDDEAIGSFAK